MSRRLGGIRVLDFAGQLSLPWLGRHMAYHGAEVITVESGRFPPKIRAYVAPNDPRRIVRPNDSPSLTDWHAGTRSFGLDLTQPESRHILDRLIAMSDVVLTNRLPRAAAATGVNYERVKSVNPMAIMVHCTSYGFSGPYANSGAFGDHVEAMAGLCYLLRDPRNGDPGATNSLIMDYVAGLHALFAVMEALRERRKTGSGQLVDLSMLETAVTGIGDVLMEHAATGADPEPGNRLPGAEPYGCFPCEDGERMCVLGVHTEGQWAALCKVMERLDWLADPRFRTLEARQRHRAVLHEEIARWTRPQPAYTVMYRLQAEGVPAGVMQESPDLLQDPQLHHRGFFRVYCHPARGGIIGTGLAVALDEPGPQALRTGFSLGEDTPYVLSELLGLDHEEIDDLQRRGVVEVGAPGTWPAGAARSPRLS